MSAVAATLRCPCGEDHCSTVLEYDAPPKGETRFDLGGAVYRRRYERCNICGHFFSRHSLDLSALYGGHYLDATYEGVGGMRDRLQHVLNLPPGRSDNAGRAARIKAFALAHFGDDEPGRTLLDVGSGIGVFPAAMTQAGWAVTAVEPDPRVAEHLRDVVGVPAHSGNLLELESGRLGRFDAVTFNKVLEHVEDPVQLLTKSREFLKERAFVYVELPDVAAAAEGPGREEFFIEHHHVFTTASVALIAERAGFHCLAIERLHEPSGKYTLRAFLVQ